MLVRVLNLAILLLSFTALQAQETMSCATYEMTEQYWEKHPEYRDMALKQEAALKNMDVKSLVREYAKTGQHLIIPVVFHIIHDNGSENISDEQVISAVKDLNMRFRKENADTANVVAPFNSIIADIQIEFRLATKDPNGQCTNGILRYKDARTHSAGDEVKAGRQWDAYRYLNIYTVRRIASGAGGYSYIPGTVGPDADGIVMLANSTGSIGTSNPNRASVLAHETGHYLGLNHTWGPSNNPGLASNCEVDDNVEDTPLTMGSFSCNTSAVSCGSHDNVQNYMDYAGCRFMFTEGQKGRIYGFIASNTAGRQNLSSPQNNVNTGTDYAREEFPVYLCQASFLMDVTADQVCPGDPVKFLDNSFFDIVSWSWTFEGAEPSTSNLENPTVVYQNGGFYDVSLTVTNSSGATETVTKEDFVYVDGSSQLGYPVNENFYDPEIFDPSPIGWFKVNNPDEDVYWKLIEPTGYDDDRCIELESNNLSTFNNLDEVISGVINLPDHVNHVMSFYFSHVFKTSPQNSDELGILISTDCGVTWTELDRLVGDSIQTATPRNAFFIPKTQEEWKKYTVDLSPYQGSTVRFKFSYVHRGGNNIYIDKFTIQNTTGIRQYQEVNDLFSVYPNPLKSGERLNIEIDSDLDLLQITNALGKVVFQENQIQAKSNNGIALPKLANGLYYIYANLNGKHQVRPLIIIE